MCVSVAVDQRSTISENKYRPQEVTESGVSLPIISSRPLISTMPMAQHNGFTSSNLPLNGTKLTNIPPARRQPKLTETHDSQNTTTTGGLASLWRPPSGRDRYRRHKYIQHEARWARHLENLQTVFLEGVQQNTYRDDMKWCLEVKDMS